MKAIVANRNIFARIGNLATGKKLVKGASIEEVPIPTITETEVLVKVHVVALNPIDHMSIDLLAPNKSLVGCDYSGEVTQVGSLAKGNWKVGDRIAGLVHGGVYTDRGSFAEYLKIEGDLAWKVPDSVDDGVAATYGVPAATAMLALNVQFGVPWLDERSTEKKDRTILIYSGSSAVGIYAIQIAKAAGWTVVTTCSKGSFDFVKNYGADHIFDYNSPTAITEIAKQFPDISTALDCFSHAKSSDFCAQVMKGHKGEVVTLKDPAKFNVPDVKATGIMVFTCFGIEFAWLSPIGPKFPKSVENRGALARFYTTLPSVIENLKPPPVEFVDGGFDGIFKGLEIYRTGEVSRKKLVVKLA